MKIVRLLSCAALGIALTLAIHAQTPQVSTYKNIDWKWSPPSTSLTSCPSGTTVACILDYQVTLTDPTGAVQTPVSVPFGTNLYTFTPGSFLYCGTWKASAVTRFYMDTGNLITLSTPPGTGNASVACPFVAPGSPGGVSGTPR